MCSTEYNWWPSGEAASEREEGEVAVGKSGRNRQPARLVEPSVYMWLSIQLLGDFPYGILNLVA
jgi:hypothetical protein